VQIFAILLYGRLIYQNGNQNESEDVFLFGGHVLMEMSAKFFAAPNICLLLRLCYKHLIIRNHYLLLFGESC